MPTGDLPWLKLEQLTPEERQLCAAASDGALLDLGRPGRTRDDPSCGEAWGQHRRIRAQVLRQLLTGHGPELTKATIAVRLRGAHIVGRLNLGGTTLRCPLELASCYIPHRLSIAKSEASNLSLRGTYLRRGLSARNVRITHAMNLSAGFHAVGKNILREARIGGQLDCSQAQFSGGGAQSLVANRLTVGNSMFLSEASFHGSVKLVGATIDGQLDCRNAKFESGNGTALDAYEIRVNSSVTLRGATMTGGLRLEGAHLNGNLDLTDGKITCTSDPAVNFLRICVEGRLFMSRLSTTGGVWLSRALLNGGLVSDDANFNCKNGAALDLTGAIINAGACFDDIDADGLVRLSAARVTGNLSFDRSRFNNRPGVAVEANLLEASGLSIKETLSNGVFELAGARISGQLNCDGAKFNNPGGVSFNAYQLATGANFLMRRATVDGNFCLRGATIGDQLCCDGSIYRNQEGAAWSADRLKVHGDFFMSGTTLLGTLQILGSEFGGRLGWNKIRVSGGVKRVSLEANDMVVYDQIQADGAQFLGEVMLIGARVAGRANLKNAKFVNPGRIALHADGLAIGTEFDLSGAKFDGEARLRGIAVGGQMDCRKTTFQNVNSVAVDLYRSRITNTVFMEPAVMLGSLILYHARVGGWHDEKKTWPTSLRLEGFEYARIHAGDATVKDRLQAWLPKDHYTPQPYEQLIRVYRSEGNDGAARITAIENERTRRARARSTRAWLPRVAWSALLRWTIGYGYRPSLALIPLITLAVSGSVLFTIASRYPNQLHAAKPGSTEQPSFNGFRFTMDLLLPVVNFKQRDSFVTGGWANWAAFGFSFSGWLLTAVVVAGLTGVFKRN